MGESKRFFVTGIDTDIGKTLVSAILVEALEADYWKPVQAGDLERTDSMRVKRWARSCRVVHPEGLQLKLAASPHLAAEKQNLIISKGDLKIPQTSHHLVVEGAGGVLVPLNDTDYLLDLIDPASFEVILVTQSYLGSLNHTFLSIESLQQRGYNVRYLVFNRREDPQLSQFIAKKTQIPILFSIPEINPISAQDVTHFAKLLRGPLLASAAELN